MTDQPIRPQGLHMARISSIFFSALLAFGVAPALAGGPTQDWQRTETRQDCSSYNALRNPYFGETHVHTKNSADAVLARVRSDARDAYRFATGEEIGLPPYDGGGNARRSITIDRPLDWAAVTDHSEGFGDARICLNPGRAGYNAQLCQDLRSTFSNVYQPTNPLPPAFIAFFTAVQLSGQYATYNPNICGPAPDYADCKEEAAVTWGEIQDAAEEFYDRTSTCNFTTFVAYEWSGNTSLNNLHRNVIFRNANVPALPITYFDQWKAEGLRDQLNVQCRDAGTGCDVLAIPHNSNLAPEMMFSRYDTDGAMMTAAEAASRAAMEPVVEVYQHKGSSECRTGVVGTTDEDCNFELLSRKVLNGTSDWNQTFAPTSYVRGALKLGLSIERSKGVNPFALGFVGGTDNHNAVAGFTTEYNYASVGSTGVADSELRFSLADASPPSKFQNGSGGLAVAWAEENSRDSIFSAIRRRETYATSGTRPIVRVFGGHVPANLCDDPEFVSKGYASGVPMGGDLGPDLGKDSPRFAVLAQKDAGTLEHPGTPLQRVQMIKGWIDPATGNTYEKVFDIAGDANNGAGVDLDTCQATGTGGSDTLCSVWEDPEFDATQNAFYYVRVLENPVCRWSWQACSQVKSCSTVLKSCSLDKLHTCETDWDCQDPARYGKDGSLCNVDYPVPCLSDSDCSLADAGTCGDTKVVNCNDTSTLPPALVACCEPEIPKTIQERAVASPIFYHADRVGITKAAIGFGKTAGTDKMQLALLVPKSSTELDPATKSFGLVLKNDNGDTIWSATIPSGTMEVKKPGAAYSYADKAGAIGGITGLSIKISKGVAKIGVKVGPADLSALSKANQPLTLEVTSGTWSSTAKRDWAYDGKSKLAVLF